MWIFGSVSCLEQPRTPRATTGNSSRRIVEGPTGTGPATWSRGQGTAWHRANGHMAVGRLSRPRPQRWGVGANSIVDSIRQEPDPPARGRTERLPVAAATHGGDVGEPALRHMRRLGNWLARLAVDQVPSRACRFESCPAYLLIWRDQPMAGDGSRLENGRPTRACEFDPRSLRQALSVQLEWTPACRAGDHGFKSRTERARPWWLLAANPDFQSGPRGFDPRPRCYSPP